MTIAERRRQLLDRYPTWEPDTLDGLLARCAGRYGDRPLVITDDRTLTYAEVLAQAEDIAGGLVAAGVRPGDRVGVILANYPEFVPVKFGIAVAGAVAVPFNYLYRRDELAYVLRQSECTLLVTMTGFGDLDYLAMLDEIAAGWETGSVAELPALKQVVLLSTDGQVREGVPSVAELAELSGATAAGSAAMPNDVGDILYTSGTTGSPKGVMVTHDAVARTGFASALTRAYEDGRRILFSLPCYHMFGYVEGLLSAMFVGGAIIPQTAFDPIRYFTGIERHRASDILCVPTMTVALVEHPARAEHDLSSCRALLSGAAPAPVWLWERVRQELGIVEITTGYGMTECGGAMTLTLPEDDLVHHSETVGRPKMAGPAGLSDGDLCEYRTADPMSGEPLAAGEEGELVSTGPTHMRGFWNKPDETAAALRDGWVFSGDLGLVRDDGYLQLTGRSKELYKSGGELVMPKEIEELLTTHPGISQAFAVGVPDERWGEVGCVWVVPEPGATVDPAEVLELCRATLARFKVPKHVLLTDAADLPTTPTGKVQKFRLSQRAAERLGG